MSFFLSYFKWTRNESECESKIKRDAFFGLSTTRIDPMPSMLPNANAKLNFSWVDTIFFRVFAVRSLIVTTHFHAFIHWTDATRLDRYTIFNSNEYFNNIQVDHLNISWENGIKFNWCSEVCTTNPSINDDSFNGFRCFQSSVCRVQYCIASLKSICEACVNVS